MRKTEDYYRTLGQSSFAIGNADGGLTTIEEKSLGAYAKSGNSRIAGLIKPGDEPPAPGLYLLDVVPDGPVRFGFPNINDNAEIARADRLRVAYHPVLDRARLGRRLGDLAGAQDLRQPAHLPPHGRRHGRQCRRHPRRRGDAR